MEENPLDTYTKMCEEANNKSNLSGFIKGLEKADKIANEHLAERKENEKVFSHIYHSGEEYKLDLNRKVLEKQNELTEKLMRMLDKFDKSSTKLSKRMFWLTVATAIIAIAQIIVALIPKIS